jgi:hypothetical protein
MQKEIWKPVTGREEFYEVSSTGKVRSLVNRYKTKGTFELSVYTNEKGYQSVDLAKPELRKYSVHRLVAEAFCSKPEGCNVVNHLDNNPNNNNYINLEWTTYSGNLKHAQQQGRLTEAQSKGGKTTGGRASKALMTDTYDMIGNQYHDLFVTGIGTVVKYGNANRPRLLAKCVCGNISEYCKIQLEKAKVKCCKECSGKLLGYKRRTIRIEELRNTTIGNLLFTGDTNNSAHISISDVKVKLLDTSTGKNLWLPYRLATSKRFLNKHNDIV